MTKRMSLEEVRTAGVKKMEPRPISVTVMSMGVFPEVPGSARARCRSEMVLADHSTAVKGYCYKRPNFAVGDTVKMRNYGFRDGRVIYHTKTSAIRCAIKPVSGDMHATAERMRLTPTSPFKAISQILTTPKGMRVSFRGNVSQVDSLREINSVSGKLPVREITVEDDSASVFVTLWSEQSKRDITNGQRVIITDALAVRSDYHNCTTVSVNYGDELKTNDAPHHSQGDLEGVSREDDGSFRASIVISDSDYDLLVPATIVLALLGMIEWDEQTAFAQLPMKVNVSHVNDVVSAMSRGEEPDVVQPVQQILGEQDDVAAAAAVIARVVTAPLPAAAGAPKPKLENKGPVQHPTPLDHDEDDDELDMDMDNILEL